MKTRIEFVANVVVILLAVVIGIVFIKDRFAPSSTESTEVKAGDKLAKIEGWDWSGHDQTLILVLKKGCHFCEDSAPFYQRLVAQQKQSGTRAAIVAVFPDAADAATLFRKKKPETFSHASVADEDGELLTQNPKTRQGQS
jgi:hypothetical protein